MTSDLEAFRAELRAAGQPYSLWGGRVLGIGLLILVVGQVMSACALALVALSVTVMGAGWILLIIGFIRRHRWAKTQAAGLEPPPLPPLS